MKKKIINTLTIFILIFTLFIVSSCYKYDIYDTATLDEIIERGSYSIGNIDYTVKQKIKTGKYNYSGDFRLTIDGEEIFNSADYDYFVPKNKTIFQKGFNKTEHGQSIRFELLDNNAELYAKYNQKFLNGHSCYVEVNNSSLFSYKTNSYERSNICDYKLSFNHLTNNVQKGLTYMFFTHEGFLNSLKCEPVYFESRNENLDFEISCEHKDANKTNFGYMIIKSKKNDYRISNSDINFVPYSEHFDIFIGDDGNTEATIEFKTLSGYVELCFVNKETEDCTYNIEYQYESHYIAQLKNGKMISESSNIIKSETKNTVLNLIGSSEDNFYSKTGEPFGVEQIEVYNVNGPVKPIEEFAYKIKITVQKN